MKKFVRSKYLSMKCVKKLLYVVSGLGILVACQQEPGYRIIGSIPGTPDGMKVYFVRLEYPRGFKRGERWKICVDGKSRGACTLPVMG